MEELLQVEHLYVAFGNEKNQTTVVEDISFSLGLGRTLGIVGESGSGKSVTSLAVMQLLPQKTTQIQGNIQFEGRDLLSLSEKEMQKVRGNRISMIFQEPMTALNPIKTCGSQIMEPLLLHAGMSKKQAKARALELLGLCGIPAPEVRFDEYPHQLSGGMRQRIMIATALACDPSLLIADEPTTALDVTIQAQIMDLLKSISKKSAMSTIIVTHDLGVVRDFCDDVLIVYCGQVVEKSPVEALFAQQLHPYTKGLLNAIPKMSTPSGERLDAIDGMVPNLSDLPGGCRFHPRCKQCFDACKTRAPKLTVLPDGRSVRCLLYEEGGAHDAE